MLKHIDAMVAGDFYQSQIIILHLAHAVERTIDHDRPPKIHRAGDMTDIVLAKTAGGALIPVDQQGIDYLAKLKLGQGVKVKVTKHNNVAFHRKMFALANLAYDAWEPVETQHKGQVIAKNFDQFRDDITILAGFYETRIRLDGSIRFIPKSWSFERMADDEKEKLYSEIINVVLSRILTKYTRDDLDAVVDSILRFA